MFKAAKSLMKAVFNPSKDQVRVPHNVPPQDLSWFDQRQKEWSKRMKKHPLRNVGRDSEQKTFALAYDNPIELDPSTSRQVRRQVERLANKEKHSLARNGYNKRLHNETITDSDGKESIKQVVVSINRPTVTLAYTGRYRAHYGVNGAASRHVGKAVTTTA